MFFDLNCIAKASQIYSSGYSNFSRLAALISGKETLVTYFQSYNTDELYNIILKNIDYVNLNNLYKAYSYYRLYDFSTQLNKDISESISFLKKGNLWN